LQVGTSPHTQDDIDGMQASCGSDNTNLLTSPIADIIVTLGAPSAGYGI